ncbi:hypothetical protein ACIPCF_11820 [Paracoccus marcusii]|uniref:hypothetical protein n=1 Tax=Paracoccus marcusii TaxID=59779 RepID=UPI0038BD7038
MDLLFWTIAIFCSHLTFFIALLLHRRETSGLVTFSCRRRSEPQYDFIDIFGCRVLSPDLESLALRMNAYAHLKEQDQIPWYALKPKGFAPTSGRRLTSKGYNILLGTLKKIEAKANSLAAIIVFLAIACVTIAASLPLIPLTKGAVLGSGAFLVLSAGMMLDLFKQVDQKKANRYIDKLKEKPNSKQTLEEILEFDLMEDLLKKEASYGVFVAIAFFSVIIIVISLLSVGLVN